MSAGKKWNLLLRIDKAGLSTLVFAAVLVVLVSGIAYAFLSPSGNGIKGAYGGRSSIANCLHFSVVTFTSLGYGDFYPVGWGKLVADFEVATGLLFLGVLIAKLASTRQNYYLAQLYASDAQKRLREFGSDLVRLRSRYQSGIQEQTLTTGKLKALHRELEIVVMRVRNYVVYEISNGDFLGEIPKAPMARILHYYGSMASLVAKAAAIPDSLHSQKQRGIAIRALGWMHEVASIVQKSSSDPSLLSEARGAVRETTKERQHVQDRFDEIAAQFPKAVMARPIEWRMAKRGGEESKQE
jgi:hypothetical protein